jgi:type II secretion system protein G
MNKNDFKKIIRKLIGYWLLDTKYQLPSAKHNGFTLIELLTVIMIIMALAGLIIGGAQQARKRALISKAQAAIASLETALSMYEVDYGGYPTGSNSQVVTALKDDPSDGVWRGPYMMFKEEDLSGGEFIDPWGNAYHYNNPGSATHGHDKYVDIWSNGPNKTDESGAGDDINNW